MEIYVLGLQKHLKQEKEKSEKPINWYKNGCTGWKQLQVIRETTAVFLLQKRL